MAESRSTFWRRHRWLGTLMIAVLIVIVVSGVALAVIARHFEPFLRASLIEGLQQKFHTRVELDQFHVSLGNGLEGEWGIWATGRGLRIWPPHRDAGDPPPDTAPQSVPLISLDEFRFHVPLRYRSGQTLSIARVRLVGLKVVVPPRSERAAAPGSAQDKHKPASAAPGHTNPEKDPPSEAHLTTTGVPPQSRTGAMLPNVIVQRIDCENAQMILETDKPDKLPLSFAISSLQLTHIAVGMPMGFKAELINPKPRGIIHSTGNLGPWQADDPGATQISGTYTFDRADLSTFRGIAGILSSTGSYSGILQEIVTDGKADVPDFSLTHFGNPLPLHTQFHARVDGTNGDTWLDPVDATLGHSHFTTRGKVVRIKPPGAVAPPVTGANIPPLADFGHDIELTVDVDRGRIEDFLHLASRSPTPILTGALTLKASLTIPPGKEPVHQRIKIDGKFKLDDARFTSDKIQGRIQELSLRGQGHPDALKQTNANDIRSEMEGEFHMANATINLPAIQYNVPGAVIDLKGSYALEGFMRFDGTARMQATVSQMVGGWKGMLLRPADRFFKKDGAGTEVPIVIRGPHDAPEFSVDFGRLKHTSPETPGQKQP